MPFKNELQERLETFILYNLPDKLHNLLFHSRLTHVISKYLPRLDDRESRIRVWRALNGDVAMPRIERGILLRYSRSLNKYVSPNTSIDEALEELYDDTGHYAPR